MIFIRFLVYFCCVIVSSFADRSFSLKVFVLTTIPGASRSLATCVHIFSSAMDS